MAKQDRNRAQGLSLPKLKLPPSLPRGPRMYQPLPFDQGGLVAGPGTPPDGFLMPWNSITEWYIYWALGIIFDNPTDPRQLPFEGGWPDWVYQKNWDGGRNSPGGSVIDFVVYNPGPGRNTIAIRVVTEYWHLYATNEKQTIDSNQKTALESYFDVVDIIDSDFINDPTGAAAIVTVKNACGMLERPNPLWLGTTLRGSRGDILGGV